VGRVKFYYIKSRDHQEVKVDGALGSTLPAGNGISVSFYTERNSIPQVVVHELSDEGAVRGEIVDEREGKDGIVRIVQTTLHMTLDQAKAINKWLGERIREIEKGVGE